MRREGTIIDVAIERNLSVSVVYTLGNKNLGQYFIESVFPMTLLLRPADEIRNNIWIPNPASLEPRCLVTQWDDKEYKLDIYEFTSDKLLLVWELSFYTGDLL